MSTKEGGAQITMEVCHCIVPPAAHQWCNWCVCPAALRRHAWSHADSIYACNVQDLTDEAKEEAAKGGGGIPIGMYN
jgi:hypothetical protein